MVISDQVSLRRSGEANLADVLDARGFTAVPAYTLIPDEEVQDEAKAKARIEASNAVAVVVFRALGAEKETPRRPRAATTAGTTARPTTGASGEAVTTGNGWSTVYASPPVTTTRTDVHVAVETLIYDLRANKLVWAVAPRRPTRRRGGVGRRARNGGRRRAAQGRPGGGKSNGHCRSAAAGERSARVASTISVPGRRQTCRRRGRRPTTRTRAVGAVGDRARLVGLADLVGAVLGRALAVDGVAVRGRHRRARRVEAGRRHAAGVERVRDLRAVGWRVHLVGVVVIAKLKVETRSALGSSDTSRSSGVWFWM